MPAESKNSPSEALASLRIDRSQPVRRFRWWKWLFVLLIAAAVGFGITKFKGGDNEVVGKQTEWMPDILQNRVEVRLASATVQKGRSADAVVVATGYLESRRQAKIGARAAGRIDKVTFEEILEMASLGSKVLQIRSVEFAGKYNVPLRVLSSFEEGEGTLITYDEEEKMEQALVSGIAFNRDEAQLTITGVPDTPGVAFKILGPISDANIEVDMIVQNVGNDVTDFTFTVHRNDYQRSMDILEGVAKELNAEKVGGDDKTVKISIVGVGMRSHAGIASKMFEALASEGINIRMISTSEIKISVLVEERYLELGVRALHAAFELDKPIDFEGEDINRTTAA